MRERIERCSAFDFCSPVRLYFAEGLIDRLAEFCPEARRVLIVTGRSSARKSGLTDRLRDALADRSVHVFSEVEPNPSIETTEQGAAMARDLDADLVVALGGGSAMDAAKVIAVLAANKGGFHDLFGNDAYENNPVRLIAIPTTCGTGSEANRYAIITDREKLDKVNFSNRQTYPALGVLDPAVLDGIPREILVGTAFDAFSHAFEGYVSRRSQPFSDILALEAMRVIVRHLTAAAEDDPVGKANLLFASTLAGIVIDHTATTVIHVMGYYLTLRHDVPHGIANAVLLPFLFEHLESALPEKSRTMYELFPKDRQRLKGVKQYLKDLGIDTSLSAYGLKPAEFDAFADYVLSKKNTATTPGRIDKDAIVKFLRKACP